MPGKHAASVLCLLLVAPLAGCGGRLAEAPAPGPSLAGAWKLNPTTSDDPQKVIERMRAQALQRMGHHEQTAPPQQAATHRGRAHGAGSAADAQDGAQQDVVDPGHHLDPLRNSQMMHVLAAALARGDFLSVRTGAGEVVFDYGTTVRSFTPGQHSVVSAEGGVGDQVSGWSGRDYVISVKAQLGPDLAERYALSADGKHLIETLRIGPAELPVINLTRVYDPTSETAPRHLPTND
ncbi:MAG TPA: hypothetical protein VK676_15010 [Steroidobacteraceae bacterium]|jgi:hypothetical protein|nr:hypothetical protein [Steroidobacteraceae bacterium]